MLNNSIQVEKREWNSVPLSILHKKVHKEVSPQFFTWHLFMWEIHCDLKTSLGEETLDLSYNHVWYFAASSS